MRTLLVSGSDTDVGKTWVVGTIASLLIQKGCSVQIVKPVETGVANVEDSDVRSVLERCANDLVTGYTICSYRAPIAPAAAAEREGDSLELASILKRLAVLPEADWRIIEGAGSLASPIDRDGADWADLAERLSIERTALVVPNRVGAIGQARMVYSYAKGKRLNAGVWLNEIVEQESVAREATIQGIQKSEIPLWAIQNAGQLDADIQEGWL